MRPYTTFSALALLSCVVGLPTSIDKRQGSNVLGSLLGVGSGNEAGNGNDATATGNGNGDTGAFASAGDFLNGASATGNGIGNNNDGNALINFKRQDSLDGLSNSIGSILGTGSSNSAGNENGASATGNGNGNAGALAGASNFLNGASATGNGIGNDNDGNALINFKRDNILSSILGTGSENAAGNDNTATANGNGNDNTGASASASNFLNGASATDNGIGNGNDDNALINFAKRLAQLEETVLQKRTTCESPAADPAEAVGSILSSGSSNVAAIADSASALANGNQNTGATAAASDFLNDAQANNNGILNDNDDNTLVSLPQSITIL